MPMRVQSQQTLKNAISEGSTIIVAISGGPDSVYLLQQCLELQKKHPFKIVIAHLNHNLRGKESFKDAVFVEKLALKHQLKCESVKIDIKKKKGNLEEIGRNARYAFFEKIRKKHRARWILTAHHLNDNIETALLNLIRGSSISGLKGIQMISLNKHLLRPLLSVTKEEILFFLKQQKIPYRQDKTNTDLNFSRNFLRHKIIPLLKKLNSNFSETFAHNLQNFSAIAELLEKDAEEWLQKWPNEKEFELEAFLKEADYSQKNILAHLYKKTYGNSNKLTLNHLEEILKVFRLKKANHQKEFGSKYFLRIDHGTAKNHVVRLEQKTPSKKNRMRSAKTTARHFRVFKHPLSN